MGDRESPGVSVPVVDSPSSLASFDSAGFDLTRCYYCGLAASTVDHVVPRSVLEVARDSGDAALAAAVSERRRRLVVPACSECNSLAGAVFDPTLEARKRRVKDRLQRRYRKVLATPDWHPVELMELAERMCLLVIASLYQRDAARKRLAW